MTVGFDLHRFVPPFLLLGTNCNQLATAEAS